MKRKFTFSLMLGLCLMIFNLKAGDKNAPKNDLKEYTGKYVISDGGNTTEGEITLVDDSTLNVSTPMGASNLEYVEKDKFSVSSFGGEILFIRDASNKVSGLKANVPAAGMDGVEAKKVENSSSSEDKDKE